MRRGWGSLHARECASAGTRLLFPLPLLSFYLCRDYLFEASDNVIPLSVAAAVVTVNCVIGAYVWDAFTEEDEGGEGGSMGSGMMGSSGSGSGSSNRNMNSAPPPQFSPYICNVAVSPKWRRLGLGMHLVRLCEQLAARQWGECVYCLIRGSVSE